MSFRSIGVFVAGMIVALMVGWGAFPRLLYRTERQPLTFSHKTHTEKAGMTCPDCHSVAASGAFSGIPKLDTCVGCHAAPGVVVAVEKIEDIKVPWRVYARQPDHVYFSHATHIKLAKLACERCHGGHGKSDSLRPFQRNRISGYSRDIWGYSIARIPFGREEHPGMKMDDCIACHRARGVQASCIGCHR